MKQRVKQLVRSVPLAVPVYAAMRRWSSWSRVTREFRQYRQQAAATSGRAMVPEWSERMYCLANRTSETPFDRHYVYHTAWATRVLVREAPELHIDISSSIYFVALASAVVPMRHLDYRPPALFLDNLECGSADLMQLPFGTSSVPSLSCMHVIEHIGLGRYGDPVDPEGDVKACKELSRVLSPGGKLLFVTPVGRPRVCFNAHRIYSLEMVRQLFPELELIEWAVVPDDASQGLISQASDAMVQEQQYACGCFLFSKPPARSTGD